MPGRITPLITNQIYHIINRGIAHQPIFFGKKDYDRATYSTFYYQSAAPSIRYSYFIRLSKTERLKIYDKILKESDRLVKILTYCFMPNHFHFLVKQTKDNGISKFMANLWNSYTRYINIKNENTGPILQGSFKAIRIETDSQLLHVHRYIHLNPYSSYIVKSEEDLRNYTYSSLKEYLDTNSNGMCDKNLIRSFFANQKSYNEFIFDRADYQRNLDVIKHLLLESDDL